MKGNVHVIENFVYTASPERLLQNTNFEVRILAFSNDVILKIIDKFLNFYVIHFY